MSPKDYQSSRQTHYKGSALLQIIRRVTTVEKRKFKNWSFPTMFLQIQTYLELSVIRRHNKTLPGTTALSLLAIAQVIYVVKDLWLYVLLLMFAVFILLISILTPFENGLS